MKIRFDVSTGLPQVGRPYKHCGTVTLHRGTVTLSKEIVDNPNFDHNCLWQCLRLVRENPELKEVRYAYVRLTRWS
jgi:hypothetical protein